MRNWLFSLPLLLAGCPQQCAPPPNTISWEGRPPVTYVSILIHDAASTRQAQAALDAGHVVDIGPPGYAHLAGHYSGVFHAGPNLSPGDPIHFNGKTYTVTRTDAARAGDTPNWRAGLTVQYSGCGGVCLVRTAG